MQSYKYKWNLIDTDLLDSSSSPPPKSLCTSPWWGEQSSRELPGEAMPSEVKVKAEENPRALWEVDRLTKNPKKLSKKVTKTHWSPYPTRRGLVTTWQKGGDQSVTDFLLYTVIRQKI